MSSDLANRPSVSVDLCNDDIVEAPPAVVRAPRRNWSQGVALAAIAFALSGVVIALALLSRDGGDSAATTPPTLTPDDAPIEELASVAVEVSDAAAHSSVRPSQSLTPVDLPPALHFASGKRGQRILAVDEMNTIYMSSDAKNWTELESQTPKGHPHFFGHVEDLFVLGVDELHGTASTETGYPEYRVSFWVSPDGVEWRPYGAMTPWGQALIGGTGNISSISFTPEAALIEVTDQPDSVLLPHLTRKLNGDFVLEPGTRTCGMSRLGAEEFVFHSCDGAELGRFVLGDTSVRFEAAADPSACLQSLVQRDNRAELVDYFNFNTHMRNRLEPARNTTFVLDGPDLFEFAIDADEVDPCAGLELQKSPSLGGMALGNSGRVVAVGNGSAAAHTGVVADDGTLWSVSVLPTQVCQLTRTQAEPIATCETFLEGTNLWLASNHNMFVAAEATTLIVGDIDTGTRTTVPLAERLVGPSLVHVNEQLAIVYSGDGETYVIDF